jgi:hypothetical protein
MTVWKGVGIKGVEDVIRVVERDLSTAVEMTGDEIIHFVQNDGVL